MAQDSFYPPSQRVAKIIFHLLLQNFMWLRTDRVFHRENLCRVSLLLGLSKRGPSDLSWCWFNTKKMTKRDLEENLFSLQITIYRHRTPRQELKEWRRDHREAPLTGLHCLTSSNYFVYHPAPGFGSGISFCGLGLPKPINKCPSEIFINLMKAIPELSYSLPWQL